MTKTSSSAFPPVPLLDFRFSQFTVRPFAFNLTVAFASRELTLLRVEPPGTRIPPICDLVDTRANLPVNHAGDSMRLLRSCGWQGIIMDPEARPADHRNGQDLSPGQMVESEAKSRLCRKYRLVETFSGADRPIDLGAVIASKPSNKPETTPSF